MPAADDKSYGSFDGDGVRLAPVGSGILGGMLATDFWERMRTVLGPAYAESFARDHVLQELGGRTVMEAMGAGYDMKAIWRAVVRSGTVEVPAALR